MRRLGLLLILICGAMAFIDIAQADIVENHNRMVEQFEQQQRYNQIIRGQRNIQRQLDRLATPPVQQYEYTVPKISQHASQYDWKYDWGRKERDLETDYTRCIKHGLKVQLCKEMYW